MKTTTVTEMVGNVKPQKSTSKRYASKKAYFARNANGALTKKHKQARMAADALRAEYWKSPEGQQRKWEKMNTPEKLAKRDLWKRNRDQRRRERQMAEQKVVEKTTIDGKDFYSKE